MRGRKCSSRQEGADIARRLGEGFGDKEEMRAGSVTTGVFSNVDGTAVRSMCEFRLTWRAPV